MVGWSTVFYSRLHPTDFDDRKLSVVSQHECMCFRKVISRHSLSPSPKPLCRVVGSANLGHRHPSTMCMITSGVTDSHTTLTHGCNSQGKNNYLLHKHSDFQDKRYGCDDKGGRTIVLQLRASKKTWMTRPTTLTATSTLPFGPKQALRLGKTRYT